MLYAIVCGEMPFRDKTEHATIKRILKQGYKVPDNVKWLISPELKDLMK